MPLSGRHQAAKILPNPEAHKNDCVGLDRRAIYWHFSNRGTRFQSIPVENDAKNPKTQLGDYLKDQVNEFVGSWLDFGRYFRQRRILLAKPHIIASEEFPIPPDIPPLKFAVQGLLLISALATFIGLIGHLLLREPSHPVTELTDSSGRISNIEQQLHFYLDSRDEPLTSEQEIDEIAHSMVRAPILVGVRSNEIQAVLDDQKRKLHGLPTQSSQLDEARVEVRKRMLDARIALFKAQHKVEPKKGLPAKKVFQQMDFIEEQLKNLNYDDSSETVTNIDAVAQQLMNAPELADATPGFLRLWLENEQNDAKEHRAADKARAAVAIKVLDRMIVVEKENTEDTKQTQERIEEIAKEIRPVLVALSLVLSAYIFRVLVRLGKSRPKQNLDRVDMAYFYLFTGGFFWVIAMVPIGILAYKALWKFSPFGLKSLLAIVGACALAYLIWALKVLWSVSDKLRVLFGMDPSRHFYNVYQGSSKIRIDLVVSNVIGSAVVLAVGAVATFGVLQIAKMIEVK